MPAGEARCCVTRALRWTRFGYPMGRRRFLVGDVGLPEDFLADEPRHLQRGRNGLG